MKLVMFLISGTINFKTTLAFWENGDHWVDKQWDIIVYFRAVAIIVTVLILFMNFLYAACKAAASWNAHSFHQVLLLCCK
ncbi:MAG: hypothetical protein AB8Z23_01075 [Coxiella-like endosymbiont]|uniref:hypothetical protein n=1 Tax=Coxiella-like endosymbiont TaxID=1592897 RepID=UPI00215B0842|nr:hypothetical protein [Coxiella-like endosymbiont]UVE59525.1 hypothetical protein LG660_00120 [Coxiella-like endosymbiont]